LSPGSSVG